MPPSNLKSAVEALLFSSDQPVTLALLGEALETTPEDLTAALQSLGEEYSAREAGVELREMSGGWVVMTRPEQAEWITRMLRGKRKTRLSRAALETMAIIAYKQPVTKSEVEAIRGVDASGVMATLLERNLVTIKGRSTVVGRPLLYGSTPEFLNYFGLKDLTELPRPEELRALVAAREPEQMEMMELDPESGMPVTLTEGQARIAESSATDAAAGEAALAAEAMAEPVMHTRAVQTTEEDEDAFSIEEADALIGGEFAEVGGDLHASDADADEDDEDGDESHEDDEFEDEDDDEELDDEYDDDDEDDEDEEEEADDEHPSAHLAKHDERH